MAREARISHSTGSTSRSRLGACRSDERRPAEPVSTGVAAAAEPGEAAAAAAKLPCDAAPEADVFAAAEAKCVYADCGGVVTSGAPENARVIIDTCAGDQASVRIAGRRESRLAGEREFVLVRQRALFVRYCGF